MFHFKVYHLKTIKSTPTSSEDGRFARGSNRASSYFTCMFSRAVHIETSTTLETDSFINAPRRFLAERGPVRQIRSDRGTNFVGAKRELADALKEMDHEKISSHFIEREL